jgi:hypothetical protein
VVLYGQENGKHISLYMNSNSHLTYYYYRRGGPVAIKILPDDDINRTDYIAEVSIMKNLRPHVNVVQVSY